MPDSSGFFSRSNDIRLTDDERSAMRRRLLANMYAAPMCMNEKQTMRSLISEFASVRPLPYAVQEQELTAPSLWLGVNLFGCLKPFTVATVAL